MDSNHQASLQIVAAFFKISGTPIQKSQVQVHQNISSAPLGALTNLSEVHFLDKIWYKTGETADKRLKVRYTLFFGEVWK